MPSAAERADDGVDRERAAIRSRAVGIDRRAGSGRLVVVDRRRLVEIVGEALHGNTRPAVGLAEADDDLRLVLGDRVA
jgi:hypothetical protein